ncbi:SDR family NAD(P)-dependent oxidoreductase [Companilactobacillus sp. HBUAS56257]|uniref:SDR family NAD(P)-dependent oxidoreductase n=1 Tax=Companilactobacillus sp. HBUAS56257 TaxID=3109360 RepID=UPI002FEF9643
MAKIFITGSTDGLGFLAAKKLLADGNEVVLHARNEQRAADVRQKLNVKNIVIGDLGSQSEVEDIAKQVNALGKFDTVIYNAGVYTSDRELTFKVNDVASYLLTALINKPKHSIYVSSGMHVNARLDINNLVKTTDYSSSKLQIVLLVKALAKRYPEMISTAVDPGWVPTKMGGQMATDDLTAGYMTQVKLATSDDLSLNGGYFHHQKPSHYDKRADDGKLQADYLEQLAKITGTII